MGHARVLAQQYFNEVDRMSMCSSRYGSIWICGDDMADDNLTNEPIGPCRGCDQTSTKIVVRQFSRNSQRSSVKRKFKNATKCSAYIKHVICPICEHDFSVDENPGPFWDSVTKFQLKLQKNPFWPFILKLLTQNDSKYLLHGMRWKVWFFVCQISK